MRRSKAGTAIFLCSGGKFNCHSHCAAVRHTGFSPGSFPSRRCPGSVRRTVQLTILIAFRKRIAAGQLSEKRSAEFIFFVYWRKIHLSFLLCGRTPYTRFLRIVSLENMARFRTTYRSTGYSTRLFRKQFIGTGFTSDSRIAIARSHFMMLLSVAVLSGYARSIPNPRAASRARVPSTA